MLSRQSASEGGADVAQRLRNLQRENAQLQLKMKGVVAEMEELQAQREHSGVTSENVQRLQVKQIAEHNAITKALEVPTTYNRSHLLKLCTYHIHMSGHSCIANANCHSFKMTGNPFTAGLWRHKLPER